MTEEQKFIFDLKGYLLIPEVLKSSEIAALKAQIDTIRTDPESLPLHERRFPGGAASFLIDHPVVMDILHETLGEVRIAVFNCYNFVGCQFHKPSVPKHIIEGLPPEKQAYFRNVWVWHQGGPDNGKNLHYEG